MVEEYDAATGDHLGTIVLKDFEPANALAWARPATTCTPRQTTVRAFAHRPASTSPGARIQRTRPGRFSAGIFPSGLWCDGPPQRGPERTARDRGSEPPKKEGPILETAALFLVIAAVPAAIGGALLAWPERQRSGQLAALGFERGEDGRYGAIIDGVGVWYSVETRFGDKSTPTPRASRTGSLYVSTGRPRHPAGAEPLRTSTHRPRQPRRSGLPHARGPHRARIPRRVGGAHPGGELWIATPDFNAALIGALVQIVQLIAGPRRPRGRASRPPCGIPTRRSAPTCWRRCASPTPAHAAAAAARMIDDPDPRVRATAAIVTADEVALCALLEDAPREVVRVVAEALAQIGTVSAVAPLRARQRWAPRELAAALDRAVIAIQARAGHDRGTLALAEPDPARGGLSEIAREPVRASDQS